MEPEPRECWVSVASLSQGLRVHYRSGLGNNSEEGRSRPGLGDNMEMDVLHDLIAVAITV